jgi:hypothetical protein
MNLLDQFFAIIPFLILQALIIACLITCLKAYRLIYRKLVNYEKLVLGRVILIVFGSIFLINVFIKNFFRLGNMLSI